MYHIYALKCEELVLYVGQTVDMRKRISKHKSKGNECGSADIPKDMDWYMEVLDNVNTKHEATQKEQFYYDKLKPLYNNFRPGQTKKEYYKANKQKILEYGKQYYKRNKN